jgi:putative membrane protein insertion efficiency factor
MAAPGHGPGRRRWSIRTPLRVVSTAAAWALLLPIHAYRRLVSPFLAPRCRFHPTCSTYAVQAIRVHGPVKGTALAAWRVVRCNPWNLGGIDPVPPRLDRAAAHQADGSAPPMKSDA